MKNKKALKIVIVLSSIFGFLLVSGGLTSYFLFLHRYHGKVIVDEFNKDNEFDLSKIKVVKKEKDKDFKILNFADVQMCDLEDIKYMPKIKEELTEIVNVTKPDLITLTGDQTWSNENLISLKSLISWMEGFKIPRAPVFGNHDFGNGNNNAVLDNLKCCELYEKAKYCLFSRGPSNLECVGNYVINIEEEGKIIKTLYMMDYGVLDDFTSKQVEWFNRNAEGIRKLNNDQYTDGMIFCHKPIHKFFDAWFNGEEVEIKRKTLQNADILEENQDILYKDAKEKGIIDFVCGHEHWFHFCYKNSDNIRFTMSLKTGELGGYLETEDTYLNGASYFTINDEETFVSDYYVSKSKHGLGKE